MENLTNASHEQGSWTIQNKFGEKILSQKIFRTDTKKGREEKQNGTQKFTHREQKFAY